VSSGKVICVVGATGEGKTTLVKKYVPKRRQSICYLRMSDDFNEENIIKFTNFVMFIHTGNRKKNSTCIIDEAFTCLPKNLIIKPGKPQDIHNQIADFLVNARKMNNFVIIIFHALAQIPLWLIPYLDFLIRFNTLDQTQYQERRFSAFPEITNSLRKSPTLQKHKPEILKLRQ